MNISTLSKSRSIGLLVVDEGHRLKNTSGSLTLSALNLLDCDSRLLITGTPIQNNLSEFYNVANFVCPGILGDLNTFRHGKWFDEFLVIQKMNASRTAAFRYCLCILPSFSLLLQNGIYSVNENHSFG